MIGRMTAENNPNWTGLGHKHGNRKYYGPNWLNQRREARERDNYMCQRCGITEEEYGQEMSVHHIKPFVLCNDYLEANSLDNLICYCEDCHRKIHSGTNHPRYYSSL
ncbi:HNH endonuclease [Bacillus sp. 123MFChir2]|uniref:HNH endonuclease n=1 Tax=Bacillus sp. 123MFChir2 TaxID=1169144 RepID=UPI0009DAC4DA|nr:HNH endonuclease [Bacillus sp. 123MFChir2]